MPPGLVVMPSETVPCPVKGATAVTEVLISYERPRLLLTADPPDSACLTRSNSEMESCFGLVGRSRTRASASVVSSRRLWPRLLSATGRLKISGFAASCSGESTVAMAVELRPSGNEKITSPVLTSVSFTASCRCPAPRNASMRAPSRASG